jgi:hypothetical protein
MSTSEPDWLRDTQQKVEAAVQALAEVYHHLSDAHLAVGEGENRPAELTAWGMTVAEARSELMVVAAEIGDELRRTSGEQLPASQ